MLIATREPDRTESGRCQADSLNERGTGGNQAMGQSKVRIVLLGILWMGCGEAARLHAQNPPAGAWCLPDTRLGIRTAPLLLLSRPDVQVDLRLERAQILGTQNTINELTRRALTLRGKTGPAVVAERRAIDEAQLEWLSSNLTGNQLERLRQIELQWEGVPAMLSRPMVAGYLKLSSEQQQTLARIIAERNRLRAQGRSAPQTDQDFRQKALSVLSSSQQELWANLLGTPFRFVATAAPPGKRDTSAQQAGYSQEQR